MKPAILLPAEAPTVYLAARMYAAMGLSVLPCTGKKPTLSEWSHLQHRIAFAPTIDLWHKVGLLQNVGIICGAVSGNLVVMDLDGEVAIEAFKIRFPSLQNTYAVTSGSGMGMHLYYYVRDLPPTTRVVGTDYGNIELRSNGTYVVAPPSIHPVSGKSYTVALASEILYLPDMRQVVEWIKRLIAQKHGGVMPPASNANAIQNATAYGRVALHNEAVEVRRAIPGERNARLYRAALKMGSLIADGKIDRASVESALTAAAADLSATDGDAATTKTITSGIDQGLMSSRSAWKREA